MRVSEAIIAAALHGGRTVARAFASRRFDTEEKSSDSDLVTTIDREVGTRITELLERLLPEASIINEEADASHEQGPHSDACIYIDPIDGTTNFVHGFGEVAVSIGYWEQGHPVAGVVYNPVHDDLFAAVKGSGATRNGKTIHASATTKISEALLGTGWPYARTEIPRTLESLTDLASESRELRTIGSAALAVCYVGAGVFDGFWEYRLSPWDLAAAILIASEAGATVTSPSGGPFELEHGEILVTNGHIHDQMLEHVAIPAAPTLSRAPDTNKV